MFTKGHGRLQSIFYWLWWPLERNKVLVQNQLRTFKTKVGRVLREFSSPLVSSWLMTVQHFTMKKVKDKSKFLVTRFQLTRVVLPEWGRHSYKLKINLQRYQRTFTQTGKARNRFHPSQIAFASAEEKSFKMRPVGLPGCFTPVGSEGFFLWIS